jgi:hypothetical protein
VATKLSIITNSIVSRTMGSFDIRMIFTVYMQSTETWDGDGVLVIRGNKCYMKDMDGKE